MLHRIFLLLFALVVCLGLSGCTANAERRAATRPLIIVLVHSPGADVGPTRSAWRDLARLYRRQKGVRIRVKVTSASSYSRVLRTSMASPTPPTLFTVDGPQGAQRWRDYLADLTRSGVYARLQNRQLALRRGALISAVPVGEESYGLLYRKDILSKYFTLVRQNASFGKAGSSRTASPANQGNQGDERWASSLSQVKSVDTFQKLLSHVQDLHSDLGISQAIASGIFQDGQNGRNGGWGVNQVADLTLACILGTTNSAITVRTLDGVDPQEGQTAGGAHDARQKENEGGVPSEREKSAQIQAESCVGGARNLTDMFLHGGGQPGQTSAQALTAFTGGKSVFLPANTSVWASLRRAGLKPSQVGFLPTRFKAVQAGQAGPPSGRGELDGFISGADAYWAVNSQASHVDQNATKTFLQWVVTSQAGGLFANRLNLWMPYQGVQTLKRRGEKDSRKKKKAGKADETPGPSSTNPLIAAVEDGWRLAAGERVSEPDIPFKNQLAPTDAWRTTLASQFRAYAASPSDSSWKAVDQAFLANWRNQYLSTGE